MSTINVTDSTFYLARLPDGDSLHDERSEAIDQLRANADGIDPESDAVSVVEVSVEGDDWQIQELAWQNIALELLGGGA